MVTEAVATYGFGSIQIAPAGVGASMNDESRMPVFTGAELALADTVILLMKVMSMHGIIDSAAILTVFNDLESRYRGQNIHGAAAMTDYLRKHTTRPIPRHWCEGGLFDESPGVLCLNHTFVNGDGATGT